MINLAIILLIAYFIIVLIIGYVSSKREKREDYLIANRKLGAWAIAFTIAATFVGGNTLVNFTGYVYSYGGAIIFALLGTVLGFLVIIPLAKRIKYMGDKKKLYNLSDYFSVRYTKKTGAVAGVIILIWFTLVITVQFIAGARVIESISPLTYRLAIVLMGLVVLAYSYMGGFKAIVKTDIFQYLLFVYDDSYSIFVLIFFYQLYNLI